MPRSILLSLVVLAACFDNPPDAEAESSSSGEAGTGSGTSADASTSASTSVASDPEGSGSGSNDGSSSDDGSGESSTTGVPACTLSGTWENVLDDEGPSGVGAQGRGMEVAADGTVYITGNADGHWLVRKSSDRGGSWDPVDDWMGEASEGGATPGGVAFADDGTVFVSGVFGPEGQSSRRIVRRSEDGQTWTTVEDFQLEFAFDTFVSAIAMATDGTIFTAGHADSSQGGRWIVRRSEDDGDTWAIDDDFQQFAGTLCLPRDIVAVQDGTMLASGHCFQDPDFMNSIWTVRRRSGAGWATVDQQGVGAFGGQGAANGAFSRSRMFVAGAVVEVSDSYWTIRVSDDGTSWSTLDSWTSPAGGARASAILDHGDGTLLALGSESGTVPTAVTRRSDDDGASWETIETYTYVQGLYGGPLVMSGNGDVYTGAIGLAEGGINHWLVRRMSCD
jgi:hypothetical protein